MKSKVLITLLILFLTGCATERPYSVWLMGDRDIATARIGARWTKNNEAGLLYQTYPNNLDNDSDLFGAYAAYHVPGVLEVENPFGGESTEVSAYIGAQTTIDENYIDQISPFTGVIFWDFLFVEYERDPFDNRAASNEDVVKVGLRFRF